jgi:hypothetical protein
MKPSYARLTREIPPPPIASLDACIYMEAVMATAEPRLVRPEFLSVAANPD